MTVKTLIRSLYPPQMLYGDNMKDICKFEFRIKEKTTGRIVSEKTIKGEPKRDNRTYFETTIPIDNPKAWTPDSPFLYEGEVSVYNQDKLVDRYSVNFGMRDFQEEANSLLSMERNFICEDLILHFNVFRRPGLSSIGLGSGMGKEINDRSAEIN